MQMYKNQLKLCLKLADGQSMSMGWHAHRYYKLYLRLFSATHLRKSVEWRIFECAAVRGEQKVQTLCG